MRGAWAERQKPASLSHAHQLPFPVENYILNLKQEHPSWGARKIRERLMRRFSDIPLPAKSTIHAVLDRHGLVERRSGRSRRRAHGTPLSLGQRPNELWCTDYKGEFLLGNRQYCYPLTVTDHASRFLLTCEALSSTRESYAFTVFERLFQERGLPASIRSDNGVPFASAHALFSLSKLAVWWLRLGIGIERIKPGHPPQNGRHERMHLTLKKKPPSRTLREIGCIRSSLNPGHFIMRFVQRVTLHDRFIQGEFRDATVGCHPGRSFFGGAFAK